MLIPELKLTAGTCPECPDDPDFWLPNPLAPEQLVGAVPNVFIEGNTDERWGFVIGAKPVCKLPCCAKTKQVKAAQRRQT